MRHTILTLSIALAMAAVAGCKRDTAPASEAGQAATSATAAATRVDEHSYAEPEKVKVKDLALELKVDFDKKVIDGSATLALDWLDKAATQLEPRHPRPHHHQGGRRTQRRQVGRPQVRARARRQGARQQAHRGDPAAQSARAHHLHDLAQRFRPAVADRGDDRRQEDALHVQPVAADPRALVGAAAGHAVGALHLHRARGRAEGRDGGDECRDRTGNRGKRGQQRRCARWRLQLQDAAADPVVPARDRRRRPGVQADQQAQRRVGRADGGGQGDRRIRRHREDDRRPPRSCTARIAGTVTTCCCCRPRSRTAAWKIRA